MNNNQASAGLPVSALALIAVNLVPLLGVIFAGWRAFDVVFLYWLETAVIGFVAILRIITAKGSLAGMTARLAKQGLGKSIPDEVQKKLDAMPSSGGGGAIKLFMVPFFCVHFGGFMTGHLFFIFAILGREKSGVGASLGSTFQRIPEMLGSWTVLALLGLAVSHLFSFARNYIGQGENLRTTAPEQMMRPYGRVVVMHIAIIFGAFLALALGGSIGTVLILICGKTLIDLKLHLRDHRRLQAREVLGEGSIL